MDLAFLGFEVDSKPLEDADKAMNKLTDTSKNTADAVDSYNESSNKAGKATDALTQRVDKATSLIKTFAVAMAGAFSVNMLTNLADTWSDLSARVGLAVSDMDNSSEAMARLSEMARSTYSSLSQTAESFINNSRALKELGYNTQQQLDYTEALNSALVVSGARAERAAMINNALSKAMAGGVLRGEELNTVIQSGGRVAEALAEKLGVGVNQLRGLGEQGQITSQIIYESLVGSLEKLRAEAESMPATIGDALTLIGNAALTLVGTFDQMGGVSETVAGYMIGIADGMMWVAANADAISERLYQLLPVFVAVFGPSTLAMIWAMVTAIGTGLVGAFTALAAAILANPLGLIAGVIAGVLVYMYQWRDSFPAIGAMFDWLYEKAMFVIETIKVALSAFGSWLTDNGEVTVNIKGEDAATKITGGITSGGNTAAEAMKNGIVSGGQSAANTMQSATQAAMANAANVYANLNGKAIQETGKVLAEGGKHFVNLATGEVTKAGETAQKAVEKGGDHAGDTIGKAMTTAGQKTADSFEVAGLKLTGNLVQLFITEIGRMVSAHLAQMRAETDRLLAEAKKMRAEAKLAEAEAAKARKEALNPGWSSGGGGSGSGGGSRLVGSGGQMPYRPIDYMHLGERTDEYGNPIIETGLNPVISGGSGTAASQSNSTQTETPKVNLQVVNVTDPKQIPEAMDTREGAEVFTNYLRNNREDVINILGVGVA